MIVRHASRDDLLGVGRVAEAAYWTSFSDLLRPDTVGQLVARDFSPSALGRMLLRGGMFVATLDGEVVGFGDGVIGDASLHIGALATDPIVRRRGVGTALLVAVRGEARSLPSSVDVLLGHLEVEQFLEHNGFVPGEVRQARWFDDDVIERRWWAEAESAPAVADLG